MKKLFLFFLICTMVLISGAGCAGNSPSDEKTSSTDAITTTDNTTVEETTDASPSRQLAFSMDDLNNYESGFWDTLLDLRHGKAPIDGLDTFTFDDVIMNVSFDKVINIEPTEYYCEANKIIAADQTLTFDPPLALEANHIISLFEADGLYVFSALSYSSGDTYIFYDGGIYEQHNRSQNSEQDYNDDIVVFTKGEDNTLNYVCYPRKFTMSVCVGDFLYHLVAKDEIYQESGSVTFKDGKPVFTMEAAKTISEVRQDLEEEFKTAKESFPAEFDDYETLDALIADNASKYEKYTCQLPRE